MNQDEKAKIVRTYFEKLTASDYQGIIDMFEADGWVAEVQFNEPCGRNERFMHILLKKHLLQNFGLRELPRGKQVSVLRQIPDDRI